MSRHSVVEVPAGGIEVIAGKTAVQIGQSIHRLPRRGTPEITDATLHDSQPAVIELQLYYPRGGHSASGVPHSAIRSARYASRLEQVLGNRPKSWSHTHFAEILPERRISFTAKATARTRKI